MTVAALGQNLKTLQVLVNFENRGTRVHLCLLVNGFTDKQWHFNGSNTDGSFELATS